MIGRERDRGAALLTVLLLVAVMAVLASLMLGRVNLAMRLAGNAQGLAEARLALTTGEALALNWLAHGEAPAAVGAERRLIRGRVAITARLDDGGNCFNVNSLVEPRGDDGRGATWASRPLALWQLRALLATLGVPAAQAYPLSDAMADWIDSDDQPAPNGAEDDWYRARPVPYRTGGQLVLDLTELRAVRGMTARLFERLEPWLCALPVAQLSPLNINTLRPDQARLLTMLAPAALPLPRAQALLAARPPGGWSDPEPVLRAIGAGLGAVDPAQAGMMVPPDQLRMRSEWYVLNQEAQVDSLQTGLATLIDARTERPQRVWRSWGDGETRALVP